MRRMLALAFSALLLAPGADAAVFNATGLLGYTRAGGFTLTGDLDADLQGLDLRQRTRYRASASLTLPDGVSLTPLLASSLPVGPATVSPTVVLQPGGITLFSGSIVTPPFRVGAVLRNSTVGPLLVGGFRFLLNNPTGSAAPGGFDLAWDVSGIAVTTQTLSGPFSASLSAPDLAPLVDDLAVDLGQGAVPSLLRLLAQAGSLPPLCLNNPQVCAAGLSVAGLDAGSARYALSLTLTPVPVPPALPLLAGALGALGLLRRARRG